MPVTHVEIRKGSQSLPFPHDPAELHPLDDTLRDTAALGQTATLERIAGKHGGNSGLMDGNPEQLYVYADMPVSLPAGPPRFIVVKSLEELLSIAAESKTDIYYTTMKTIGSAEIGGRRGPVITYEYNVVDWEQAAWKLLSEDERSRRVQPVFREWLFGTSTWYAVIHEGPRLIIYEGAKIVS